ncbi:hypothetical protein GCM10009839_59500 [Catenulispora yoronensis]|uniref:Uncharacterized protein n=1 Tax=Catenulispora yoronensis TaxID=450799 RepID=A0ABN2V2V4_9ACTN
MSEEQRDQPRNESEAETGSGAGAGTKAAAGAVAAGRVEHREARVEHHEARVYDLHDGVGDGSPRYGEAVAEIPESGSEESWSAAPHPGYERDPKSGFTSKRLAAGTLIGCLILALGVFYGTRILTGRSSNGFGAQPWTAAVKQDGAVVGGINAQNSDVAPPVELPPDQTFGTSGGK